MTQNGEGPKWIGCHVYGGPYRSANYLDQADRCMTRARST
ncbi:unnamed protein product [Spirodela intermedia]|uniref:Uncharacterized protein n=1 Tax=Spirodela intermedia TaxID=51605 RepID=A0A7I8KGB2_SPIIN|nr:unnamed protein product [Spirodela intermedia]